MEHPMSELNDLSRSLTSLEQDKTIIAVIEMSQSSWLVAGIIPGIERHPLKKLEPSEEELVRLLMRWRTEATKNGHTITRFAVAFEAGRDGFWLARWLRARDIETYVIHPTSVAVSREHRRAKTDRLDTGLLKRVFIGWLRGEPDHCHMAAIPTLAEEDAKRPNREREGLVRERTRIVNRMKSCLARFGVRSFKPTLRKAPERLATLVTPEGVPLPPNTLLELRRDMARLRFVMDQIKEVEEARAQRLDRLLRKKRMRWSDCSPVLLALASKRRTCWCMRSCRGVCGIDEPWRATLVSPARQTRAAANSERKGSPRRATHGYAAE
jgi:transposase